MGIPAFIVLSFAILACSFPLWRALLDPEGLRDRVPSYPFDEVAKYTDDDSPAQADDELWAVIGGTGGLWIMSKRTCLILADLQYRVGTRQVSQQDALVVWRYAAYQVLYTGAALMEAGVCKMLPGAPHFMALGTIQFHTRVTLRAQTLTGFAFPERCKPLL